MKFSVIDKLTGQALDCEKIALTEECAKALIYCGVDGFAITEDNTLILLDDCGNVAYCPSERFTVEPEALPIEAERHQMNQKGDTYDKYDIESYRCPKCEILISQQKFLGEKAVGTMSYRPKYCPYCGQRLKWEKKTQ